MGRLLAALAVTLALVAGLMLALRGGARAASERQRAAELRPGAESDRAELLAEIARAERRIEELERELADLRAAGPHAPEPTRRPESPHRAESEEGPIDARWYLEQYVRSFDRGGSGSEKYRLAVQAYAPELVDAIAALVVRDAALVPLRVGLAGILGDARLAGNDAATSALLATLDEDEPEELVVTAVASLRRIAVEARALDLAARVWRVRFDEPRAELLRLVLDLAGGSPNAILAILMRTAPDAKAELELVAALRGFDLEGALELFQLVSFRERDTRLAGAKRLREFRDDRTVQLAEEWKSRETHEEVRDVLGAALEELKRIPSYAPERATGPPNVSDPTSDNAEAWAAQSINERVEWLELDYSPAIRASEVSVHQVMTGGGVSRVTLIDESGARRVVWEGRDASDEPGVSVIRFAPTSYRVRGVRLDVDTTRHAEDWEEIDAVQLAGPDGALWASGARASSYWRSGY